MRYGARLAVMPSPIFARERKTKGSGRQPAVRSRPTAGAGPILLVIAVLATIGTFAALLAHHNNAARVAAFRADPTCRQDRLSVAPGAPVMSCTIATATIASRWIHRYKGSRYYRLAVQPAGGGTDSVELKGSRDKSVWNLATPGSVATVTLFTESPTARRRVTRVTTSTLTAITSWNPEWRDTDSQLGVWFLGITAAACMMALAWIRWRRTPPNLGEPLV